MKSFLIVVFFLLLPGVLHSSEAYADGTNEYDIRNIPADLLPAKAVIRNNTVSFEVLNPEHGRKKVRFAVTIFSKDEQEYGVLVLNYNKFIEVADLDGVLYDASGEEIRGLESRDIKDYSDFTSYALLDDNRVRLAELYYDKFPYTVEFTYELEYNSYLNWPSWLSRKSSDPVQHSEFSVLTPSDYNLRWWCSADSVQPAVSKEGGSTTYYWSAENLSKLPDDQENEDLADYAVIVRTAPLEFNIEGFPGSMGSWKDFGKWYFQLAGGRDILPEKALQDIEDIVQKCQDRREKINKLYNYMQSRTRYVSIQLGIGSWQPFEASYVHNNGYGDCKALSNYMISILKAAGIRAYPVLIESGEQEIPLITGFPCNQFNHVIVVVPDDKDTVWLECTSQDLPAGSLSSSCENRKALLITPNGGALISAPLSTAEENIQKRTAVVRLTITGNAEATVHTKWTGDQHHTALYLSKNTTFEEQEKWIKKNFKVPDIKLNKFSFIDEDRSSNEISLDISAELPRYGSVTGSRIFFNPNITDRRTNIPNDISEKLSPVKYSFPYLDIDSVKFILPERYMVEAMPSPVNIETSFGKFFSQTIKNEDNSLTFSRQLEIKNYSIPPGEYADYRNFFSEIVKADRGQVVLSKKK